ncbi:uncharacterized protein LOC131951026 [Physella acuta]|uniref:uncharacterized protein LOC131951026 n=1 Tax=Physella acuta TaxID=109671 RepID=UPI0027DCC1E2|nr:uncharacterized protein LOC131951026 [Physella acuta]XP_059169267.1 uncharacterized protein LOC131951026 [Physella acuta]
MLSTSQLLYSLSAVVFAGVWAGPTLNVVDLNTPTLQKLYGTQRNRKEFKLCRIFKCLYVEMGCADLPLKQDDDLCRGKLYESLKMADSRTCPWRPCEGYDQPEHHFCQPGPTECPVTDVPHGLCGEGQRCCSTKPVRSPDTPEFGATFTGTPLTTSALVSSSAKPASPSRAPPHPPAPHEIINPSLQQPYVRESTPYCEDSNYPGRRCLLGAFCSFDPADKMVPNHICNNPEEICCESTL